MKKAAWAALAAMAFGGTAIAQEQAPAANDQVVQVNMALSDVVRCTSIYKAVMNLSQEGSDVRNLATVRAMQWGTAAFGVFPKMENGPTEDAITAQIQAQDQLVNGEVQAAQAQSRANQTETQLFTTDFAKCDQLMAGHQPLFKAINDSLQQVYGQQNAAGGEG